MICIDIESEPRNDF